MNKTEKIKDLNFFHSFYKKKKTTKEKVFSYFRNIPLLFPIIVVGISWYHQPQYIKNINDPYLKLKNDYASISDLKEFSFTHYSNAIDSLKNNYVLDSEILLGQITLNILNNNNIKKEHKQLFFEKYSKDFFERLTFKSPKAIVSCVSYDLACNFVKLITIEHNNQLKPIYMEKIMDYDIAINATASALKIQPTLRKQ